VKITYSYNCCSLLIISTTKVHDYDFGFFVLPIGCRGCATPEGVTTATHIVTLNSSGFRGIHNGNCNLVIIDIHARK
jgi:hypothetical protein